MAAPGAGEDRNDPETWDKVAEHAEGERVNAKGRSAKRMWKKTRDHARRQAELLRMGAK